MQEHKGKGSAGKHGEKAGAASGIVEKKASKQAGKKKCYSQRLMSDVFKQATHRMGAGIFKFLLPGSISNGTGWRRGGKTLRDGFFGKRETDGSLKRHSTGSLVRVHAGRNLHGPRIPGSSFRGFVGVSLQCSAAQCSAVQCSRCMW